MYIKRWKWVGKESRGCKETMSSWRDKEVTACRNDNESITEKAEAEEENEDEEKGGTRLGYFLFLDYIILLSHQPSHVT